MKIVFLGTSPFSAQILKCLHENGEELLAVVTRPDRQQGRSMRMLPPAVKKMHHELDLSCPLYQPERVSTAEFEQELRQLDADLYVVVAFGEIIKQNILDLPSEGCINIHASLLPKYRGAAPIQRCLMNGEKESGITIIEMVRKMDAGDMLDRAPIPIPQEMTFGELEESLCHLACERIIKVIGDFKARAVSKEPQDESKVTFADKIQPEELQIDWKCPAEEIHNLIRAFSPKPGAWTILEGGKRLKIKRARVRKELSGELGEVVEKPLVVACGKEALELLEVQAEGKKTMLVKDFLLGNKNEIKISV